jgi:hypothetical protein
MARLLEKALRRSEAVDREALCIVAGRKVRLAFRGRQEEELRIADLTSRAGLVNTSRRALLGRRREHA